MPNRTQSLRGADRTTHPGNIDGRLAHDIVEAALILRAVKRLDYERAEEKRHRAKIAAITLQKMPWD